MDEFKKQLGRKIKQIRNSMNLKQDVFCTKIGIEAPTLSNIENGKSYPTLTTLKNIIDAFQIEPNEIFEFDYLLDESEIDKKIKEIYESFDLEKKQYFYRLIKFLFEYKN